MMEESADVLIVGAGPTGLTLANVLARLGVSVRVAERQAQLSRHTKATNLMQRTQELLASIGLMDELTAIGGRMRLLMVHAYGKCFGPRTMRLDESPFPDVLLCGQHNFEAVAARSLVRAGAKVEHGVALTALRQDERGAIATLVADGREETARFRFVVGCDGASGITRTFTRLDFQPKKTGVAIRQVDCKLSWRRLSTMDQMWLFYFDRGFAVVVPLPGGVHRVLTIEPKSAFPERAPTLAEMEAKLREVTHDGTVSLREPDWFSYTDLSMGLASGLRDGNIFLAGDVGNPVLPNGGQGMNAGIADAFNLGWKLAAVLRHGAADALLDTYEHERHSLRTALQRAQYNSLKYTTLVTPKAMQAAFRVFAEPLLDLGGEYKMAQAFSELTIHTRTSPLSLETMGARGVRAGDRARDASVVRGSLEVRLHQLLYRGSWTLLAFIGRGRQTEAAAVLGAVAQLGRPDLSTFIVSTESTTEAQAGAVVLYDLDEEAHRVYGLKKAALLLIRPDGHVGARVRPGDVGRLGEFSVTSLAS